MVALWGREVEVIVYKKTDSTYIPVSFKNYDEANLNKFRMTFNIRFDSTKNKNDSDITIYNLASLTREEFAEEPKLSIQLYVGYSGERTLIYDGDVRYVSIGRTGADVMTKFVCGDGIAALKNIKISSSFKAGTQIKSMVKFLGEELKKEGINFKDSVADIFSGAATFGEVLDGKVNKLLDKLCKRQNLTFSITNNTLELTRKGQPVNQDAVFLSPETGLIGLPERNDKTIRIKALIQPSNIFPRRLIQLESETENGFFLIDKCVYNGDTHSNNWVVMIEAQKYG